MQDKRILLFHVNERKIKQIEKIGKTLGIRIEVVPKSKYGQSLGRIAGIQGIKQEKRPEKIEQELPAEMMIFSGIDSEGLDLFLEKYRTEEIEPIGLKATITPYNIKWNVMQVYEELVKEHMMFHVKH